MKQNRYPLEVQERAVRLFQEQREQYPSKWAAVVAISSKMGCKPQTMLTWIDKLAPSPAVCKQAELEQQLRVLERENKELRRANEIIRKAAAFFAQAELDRKAK